MHAASSPGQQYTAGDCWVAMEEKIGRFDDCPMCRAPLRVPAKDKVERLLGLVARSPGGVCTRMARGAAGPADHAKAARLYHLAADQGLTRAQCGLGMIYQGVPQDVTEAVRLYRLAGPRGARHGGGGAARSRGDVQEWHRGPAGPRRRRVAIHARPRPKISAGLRRPRQAHRACGSGSWASPTSSRPKSRPPQP